MQTLDTVRFLCKEDTMHRNDASVTAAGIAARIGQPAWIYSVRADDYQVACMTWEEFTTHLDAETLVAVTLPNGREFMRLANTWERK